jgi:hypothetical protein
MRAAVLIGTEVSSGLDPDRLPVHPGPAIPGRWHVRLAWPTVGSGRAPPHESSETRPGQPVTCCRSARVSRYAAGERSRRESAAALPGPGAGACRQAGQARDRQPGPQAGGMGELPQPDGQGPREQHRQASCERGHHPGGHPPGPQPQQTQAQAHQGQHRHIGPATGARDVGPAGCITGWPAASARCDNDGAPAIPSPLACPALRGPVVPAVRWAKLWREGPAATASWTAPARPGRGPLPAPAATHPVTRIAITLSSAPARFDRAWTCEAVIAPSGTAQVVPI